MLTIDNDYLTIDNTIATIDGNYLLQITSSNHAVAILGQLFSYQITANNGPTSFTATNLPPGLTINASTGLISGIPT